MAPDAGAPAADELLCSAIRPSKQLLTLAAKEIRDREQFVLLDEQRVAYELVLAAVEEARRADTKTVVVVAGGPGSGDRRTVVGRGRGVGPTRDPASSEPPRRAPLRCELRRQRPGPLAVDVLEDHRGVRPPERAANLVRQGAERSVCVTGEAGSAELLPRPPLFGVGCERVEDQSERLADVSRKSPDVVVRPR